MSKRQRGGWLENQKSHCYLHLRNHVPDLLDKLNEQKKNRLDLARELTSEAEKNKGFLYITPEISGCEGSEDNNSRFLWITSEKKSFNTKVQEILEQDKKAGGVSNVYFFLKELFAKRGDDGFYDDGYNNYSFKYHIFDRQAN